MKPTVFEPTPGPFAPDGDVQEVDAEEAADVQTTARSSARRLPAARDFLLRRVMRFLSMRGVGLEALTERFRRELAPAAQQHDEDAEGQQVGEGVEPELVDVVAVGL